MTDSLSFSIGLLIGSFSVGLNYQMNYPVSNYCLVYFYRDVWMEGSAIIIIRAGFKKTGLQNKEVPHQVRSIPA